MGQPAIPQLDCRGQSRASRLPRLVGCARAAGPEARQLDMMMNIYRHPGMSQQELAEKLIVCSSNITM